MNENQKLFTPFLLCTLTILSNVISVAYSTFMHGISALMRRYSAKLNARDFHKWSEDPGILIF
jgi:hypothetical protein